MLSDTPDFLCPSKKLGIILLFNLLAPKISAYIVVFFALVFGQYNNADHYFLNTSLADVLFRVNYLQTSNPGH